MRSKYFSMNQLILFCITVVIVGCASVPQFIPEQVESRPVNELAEVNIYSGIRDVEVDGEKVRSTKVYLTPGVHSMKYKVYGETELWKNMVKSMEKEGFTLSGDGNTFVKNEGGLTTSARPMGVSRYGWNIISKDVSFEVGRKYWFSNLWP